MIQRIQTIFLALVVVLFGVLFFVPVYTITNFHNTQPPSSFTSTPTLAHHLVYLQIITSIVAFIASISILMYKNRKRQLLITRLGMLASLLVFILVISFPGLFSGAFMITQGNPVTSYNIGVYLLSLNIILFFLASRSIKKDDDLVKAADRLR